MKIQYLLEAFTTTERQFTSNNKFKTKSQNYSKGGLGGRVYSQGNEHTLIKIPHNAEYNDEYEKYIKFIVDNKLAQENPHFPRVYSFNSISDASGKNKYKIEIERLFHSNKLNDDQREAILNMYFNDDAMEYYNKWYGHYELHTKFDIMCVDILDKAISTGNTSFIIDQQLAQACTLINQYICDNKLLGNIDMHSGNFMFRIAKSIPQLVITDPLA